MPDRAAERQAQYAAHDNTFSTARRCSYWCAFQPALCGAELPAVRPAFGFSVHVAHVCSIKSAEPRADDATIGATVHAAHETAVQTAHGVPERAALARTHQAAIHATFRTTVAPAHVCAYHATEHSAV
jgi:hypothetical protein